MNMTRYPFNIVWSEDDQEYLATCPSFPGLSAFGETEEEALDEAKIALKLFIESYQERGIALPKPPRRSKFSGQLRLRLSRSLHERAAEMASKDGVSLNQYIANALNREVSSEEALSK
jgi:predicted RNase H-like HicB family nuclease